jgi:hypothetical protein
VDCANRVLVDFLDSLAAGGETVGRHNGMSINDWTQNQQEVAHWRVLCGVSAGTGLVSGFALLIVSQLRAIRKKRDLT